jgi:hypothetical protein
VSYNEALEALSRREIEFEEFAKLTRTNYERWAGYYIRKRNPQILDVDDLVNVSLFTTWRAVDDWDSTKLPIVEFVQCRVKFAMLDEIDRAVQWSFKKKRAPIETVPLMPSDVDLQSVAAEDNRHDVRQFAERVKLDPLEMDVIAALTIGMNTRSLKARVYADEDRRNAYGFRNEYHALRQVMSATKRVLSKAEGYEYAAQN